MSKLTNQQVFNKVVTALRAQGCKSIRLDTHCCLYRGPDNTKCAAGHILPDELYNESLEKLSVTSLGYIFDHIVEDMYFLNELQRIHDHCHVLDWESQWQRIASLNNLNYSAPAN
jgi:hypothetical protein